MRCQILILLSNIKFRRKMVSLWPCLRSRKAHHIRVSEQVQLIVMRIWSKSAACDRESLEVIWLISFCFITYWVWTEHKKITVVEQFTSVCDTHYRKFQMNLWQNNWTMLLAGDHSFRQTSHLFTYIYFFGVQQSLQNTKLLYIQTFGINFITAVILHADSENCTQNERSLLVDFILSRFIYEVRTWCHMILIVYLLLQFFNAHYSMH